MGGLWGHSKNPKQTFHYLQGRNTAEGNTSAAKLSVEDLEIKVDLN